MDGGTYLPQDQKNAVEWLRIEYIRRREKNASYSLRAFAKSLQVSPGPLSEILANKRRLTLKQGEHIAERLAYDPKQRETFLQLIHQEAKTAAARLSRKKTKKPQSYESLTYDAFHLISDWYHYAILSLMETDDFESRPNWIAKRLGISVIEVRTAWDRLRRLGLIKRYRSRWRPTYKGITTPDPVPRAALHRLHTQTLEKCIEAVNSTAPEDRDITMVTFACDPSKLPDAKNYIRNFRRDLAQFLEQGEKSEVFNLCIQLIPITQKGESK